MENSLEMAASKIRERSSGCVQVDSSSLNFSKVLIPFGINARFSCLPLKNTKILAFIYLPQDSELQALPACWHLLSKGRCHWAISYTHETMRSSVQEKKENKHPCTKSYQNIEPLRMQE